MALSGDTVKAVAHRLLCDCLDLHDQRINVVLPDETSNYGLPPIPAILWVVYLHYQNLNKKIKATKGHIRGVSCVASWGLYSSLVANEGTG